LRLARRMGQPIPSVFRHECIDPPGASVVRRQRLAAIATVVLVRTVWRMTCSPAKRRIFGSPGI
jgi:hypothetical protein